jgi:predicted alpha/beta-fold hydrolase
MESTSFKPAWWLKNPHMQTIWPTLCRRAVKNISLRRERFELPDGDFVDLDWIGAGHGPIVVILHGFEGSVDSTYATGMLHAVEQNGWRGVLMNFRGCSGEPNRLPKSYHSGHTEDLDAVIKSIRVREPSTPVAAIGFSLGGNVLLKWLGETQKKNPLNAAIAISVPFELDKAADRICQGFSQFYQWYMLRCVQKRLEAKFQKQRVPIFGC